MCLFLFLLFLDSGRNCVFVYQAVTRVGELSVCLSVRLIVCYLVSFFSVCLAFSALAQFSFSFFFFSKTSVDVCMWISCAADHRNLGYQYLRV